MYGWTLSTILSFIVRFTHCVQNPGISEPVLNFEEFVIISCTPKGPVVFVSWLATKNVRKETWVTSKVDPVLSITDTCCSVRNSNMSLRDTESLLLWRWKHSTKKIATCEGADVELFCNVTGSFYPIVNWRRRGEWFYGESLLIPNIKRHDHGIYLCEASNGFGRTLRNDVTIIIEFPPIVTVPKEEINTSHTGMCTLQCLVEAYPTASITWYKEGIALNVHFDPYYEISIREAENYTTLSTLRVVVVYNDTLVNSRFGSYTCKAQNVHGTSEASIRLMAPCDKKKEVSSDGHFKRRNFNVSGFIIGMLPPIFISVYIIIKLGYRSRYAEERPEEDGVRAEPFFVSH